MALESTLSVLKLLASVTKNSWLITRFTHVWEKSQFKVEQL